MSWTTSLEAASAEHEHLQTAAATSQIQPSPSFLHLVFLYYNLPTFFCYLIHILLYGDKY